MIPIQLKTGFWALEGVTVNSICTFVLDGNIVRKPRRATMNDEHAAKRQKTVSN